MSSDVAAALVPSKHSCHTNCFSYCYSATPWSDLAQIGILTQRTTMNDIVKKVMAYQQKTVASNPSSPSSQLVQVLTTAQFQLLMNPLAMLRKDQLGNSGFARFLEDDTMISKHPELAESVLFSERVCTGRKGIVDCSRHIG